MIATKKALNRRTVLRGMGAALALPFLDSMVPAFAQSAQTAARPVKRLGIVYVPNGIRMEHWTPVGQGLDWETTQILEPLAPYRKDMLIVSGLTNAYGPQSSGVHARASTKFLTGMPPKFTQGADLSAGISMDQIVARTLERETQLSSLELALESTEAGTCDVGFSCAYTNTIAWRSQSTPLPMEHNPRVVFERLFGDSGSTDSAALRARLQSNASILDSVSAKVSSLERALGASDIAQLSEYLDAIRNVERRIQLAEQQGDRDLPTMMQPAGIPGSFAEHARLMFDLQVLAYQADLTRVVTFMVGREFSGRTYPEIGAPDAHHPTSHHQNDPEKLDKLTKINRYHTTQLAYYLDRLQNTPDGDGSLLDRMLLIYGAGMSDGNAHSPANLPILLFGGGGALPSGHHIKYPGDTPVSNLHVTLLGKLGVDVERLAGSTGSLPELSL
jgi:hypothetical protein